MSRDLSEGSGHAQGPVYLVEARTVQGVDAETIDGIVFTHKWKRLSFPLSPIGVPSGVHLYGANEAGFVSYEAAEALAAWFRTAHRAFFMETRIVEVEYIVDWKATRTRNGPPVSQLGQQQAFKAASVEAVADPPAAGDPR